MQLLFNFGNKLIFIVIVIVIPAPCSNNPFFRKKITLQIAYSF